MSENIFKKIDFNLIKLMPIVLSAIGIIGNSLVFYILARQRFLKESIFRYFMTSEIVASAILITMWAYSMLVQSNIEVSRIFCKPLTWLLYSFYHFYPWVNVLNSVDRFLTLKYSTKFKITQKLKYQVLALFTIFLIILLLNIPIYLNVNKTNNDTICDFFDKQTGFYFYLFNLIISCIIPFTLMIFSTCLVLNYFIRQKVKLKQNIKNYKREKDFIKSVLTLDLWFLICYSPFCIMSFLNYSLDFNYIDADIWNFVFDLSVILAMAEISCNFFIYLLSNKLFRSYFISMIICRERRQNNLTVNFNLTNLRR